MRILQIAPRVCWPLDTGAKLRNYHLARVVAQRAEVSLLAFAETGQPAPELRRVYADVITVPHDGGYSARKVLRGAVGKTPLPILNYTSKSMQATLARLLEQKQFDVIQIESIHLINCLRRTRSKRPRLVCDWHNIESDLMRQYANAQPDAFRRAYAGRTARLMQEFEARALREFDAHVCVSEPDANRLRGVNPGAKIYVIENGVDTDYYLQPAGDGGSGAHRRIVFVGSMDYHANADAVVYFARDVWPQLHRQYPDLVFTIVGKSPTAQVQSLASISGIEITGTVDDVRPFYGEAIASIVPLRVGGGSRLKILEAMAAGVPVISTTLGAEGLDVVDEKHILIADSDADWIEAIGRVVENADLRQSLVTAARALVAQHYDWSKPGESLFRIYEQLTGANQTTSDYLV